MTRIIPIILFAVGSPSVQAQSDVKFESANISFINKARGFEAVLAGTLKWPAGKSKCPAVVFVHGSGRSTRDELSFLVPAFLAHGYAVFGYDKRGVGESQGAYTGIGPLNSPVMMPLLGSDAAEAVKAIAARPEVDPKRITIFGGSQAGWIIPVAASMSTAAAYVILYGPTVSVGEEIYYSDFAEQGKFSIEAAEDSLKLFKGNRGFDPVPYIERLQKNGLWLFGARDVSIPSRKSIDILESIRKAHQLPVTIKVYPQADHGLINVQTGQREDYMPFVLNWLDAHLK